MLKHLSFMLKQLHYLYFTLINIINSIITLTVSLSWTKKSKITPFLCCLFRLYNYLSIYFHWFSAFHFHIYFIHELFSFLFWLSFCLCICDQFMLELHFAILNSHFALHIYPSICVCTLVYLIWVHSRHMHCTFNQIQSGLTSIYYYYHQVEYSIGHFDSF